MVKKVNLYEVFNDLEDEYVDDLGIFEYEYVEGVTNYNVDIYDSESWYNFYKVTFDYGGYRYMFKYKEHTSENVSDIDVIDNSLVRLGKADQMEDVVTKEEMKEIELRYIDQIERLKSDQKKLEEERQQLKDIKKLFRKFGTDNLDFLSEVYGEEEDSEMFEELAKVFKGLAKMKKMGDL